MKKTIKGLEEQVRALEPYREAYMCLMAGLVPVCIRSDETNVTIVGLERASGGVVIGVNGQDCAVRWVSDALTQWRLDYDPYFREIASKVTRLQVDALGKRDEYVAKRRGKDRVTL